MRVLFLPVVVLIFSCSQQTELTESEIRLQETCQAQRELVEKANAIIVNLSGDLSSDLSNLLYARELSDRAEKIFTHGGKNCKDALAFSKLKSKLNSFEEPVAEYAVKLLKISLVKTVDFRKSMEDMPSNSISRETIVDNSGVLDFLSKKYNQELSDCCFDDLTKISKYLRRGGNSQYRKLRKIIINLHLDLGNVLSEPELESGYRERIVKSIKS